MIGDVNREHKIHFKLFNAFLCSYYVFYMFEVYLVFSVDVAYHLSQQFTHTFRNMSSNKPTGSSAEPTAEKVPPSPPAMKKRRKYFFGVPETPMAPRQVTMNFIKII